MFVQIKLREAGMKKVMVEREFAVVRAAKFEYEASEFPHGAAGNRLQCVAITPAGRKALAAAKKKG
jgi:hypothetical protein